MKNKDWWNYLTKDNGADGMVPLMLNKTQLQDEGYYSDLYWEEHGARDAAGRLLLRNGRPYHDLEHNHEKGRDDHGHHDQKTDAVKKANFDSHAAATNGGNGWLPPELKADFGSESKKEQEEEGEERRAKDKKQEEELEDNDKKDEKSDKKEEKGDEKKDSKEESKEPEKKEEKESKKEDGTGLPTELEGVAGSKA